MYNPQKDFLKTLSTKVKITFLRRRARKLYVKYINLADEHDCGLNMADVISGGKLSRYRKQFNETLDKLKSLGENVPESRL